MKLGGTDRALAMRPQSGRWSSQQSVFWYGIVYALFSVLVRLWIRRFAAVGMENVPKDGGVFLVANHESGIDPFVVGWPVRSRMMRGPGKEELFANPVFGYIMRRIGMFPIRQEISDTAAVRAMVELYRNGRVVIVYPEGGRTDDGELQPFFPGFARLMIKLKARMIPVGIDGAREMLPIGSYVPKFNSPVAVAYGKEFELSEYYGRKMTDEIAAEAAAALREKVAAMVKVAERERAKLML